MENLIEYLAALNPIWVYVAATAIAYTENIFPPFPSDVILVAAGSLAGFGKVDFTLLLVLSTAGSMSGFMTMYEIGEWFGMRILERGKMKFIAIDKVHKLERWFNAYGYWIVIANRFLAGTRAAVAFFAGMSKLSLWKTTCLASLSSLLWNSILLFAGKKLGENWRDISVYLEAYGELVTFLIIPTILIYAGWQLYKKRTHSEPIK
jgi:membrane protein DedA with SNARE-associated domain